MTYDIKGTVKVVHEAQTFASGFSKRQLVITVPDEKYPQDISFDFTNENISLLDKVNIGDMVSVAFNIRGNEYNGKYYTNLHAWKLVLDDEQETPKPMNNDQHVTPDFNDYEDDIPF